MVKGTCSVQQTTCTNGKCSCFRSKRESDKPVPRVLSRVCESECTTQAPFSNNKLCCFHIGQELGLAQQSQSLSTQSWRVNVCISKPITKTLWIPFEYLQVKKMIYSEGTLQHYLLLLFNICLALITFNNSGLTYIRCSK